MTYEQYKKADSLVRFIENAKHKIETLHRLSVLKSVTIEGRDERGIDVVYTNGCSDDIAEIVKLEMASWEQYVARLNAELEKI